MKMNFFKCLVFVVVVVSLAAGGVVEEKEEALPTNVSVGIGSVRMTSYFPQEGEVALFFPNSNAYYLDQCMTFSNSCGQQVPDAFCQIKGHSGSFIYGLQPRASEKRTTKMLQSGELCRDHDCTPCVCTGYSYIICH